MADPWEAFPATATESDPWAAFPTTKPSRAASAAQSDDRAWYQKLGGAADDIARIAANAATFGYADKFAGYMGGEGTAAEREKTQASRDRARLPGEIADIGVSLAVPMAASKVGLSATRLLPQALQIGGGAAGLAARTGAMAAEGAGYGALGASGHDQNIGTGALLGAGVGAAGNVAGEGLSAAIKKVAGAFNAKPAIPDRTQIEAVKDAAYARADQSGVIFTPAASARLNQTITNDLANFGYDPALQPGAAAVIKRLQDLQGQNVTLTGLDTLRKVANNGYIPGNKSNNSIIRGIIEHIDDAVANPQSGEILTGNSQTAAQALGEARSAASRLFKLDKVDDAVARAELRAGSTGSGGNVDNATRQNIRRILEKPRGFTPDEQEALRTVVMGTPAQNALRLAGKLSPSGNGLMAALGVGGAMVNPWVGAASLAGMGAKAAADRMTQSNVQKIADIISAGGSRSATQSPPNAVQRLADSKRDAIARLLMGTGLYAVSP